jgi:hypothetical protein
MVSSLMVKDLTDEILRNFNIWAFPSSSTNINLRAIRSIRTFCSQTVKLLSLFFVCALGYASGQPVRVVGTRRGRFCETDCGACEAAQRPEDQGGQTYRRHLPALGGTIRLTSSAVRSVSRFCETDSSACGSRIGSCPAVERSWAGARAPGSRDCGHGFQAASTASRSSDRRQGRRRLRSWRRAAVSGSRARLRGTSRSPAHR